MLKYIKIKIKSNNPLKFVLLSFLFGGLLLPGSLTSSHEEPSYEVEGGTNDAQIEDHLSRA